MNFLQILVGILFGSYINIANNLPYDYSGTQEYYYDYSYDDYEYYDYEYYDYEYYDDYEYEYLLETYKGIADEIIKNNGITIDMYDEESLERQEYYALKVYTDRTAIFDIENFTDEDVAEYMLLNSDILYYYGHAFGAWINNGKVYLDVPLIIPEKCKDEALRLGEKYNERAIFDLKNMQELPRSGNIEIKETDEYEIWDDIDELYYLGCFDY